MDPQTPEDATRQWLEKFEGFGRSFHAAALSLDSFERPSLAMAVAQVHGAYPSDLQRHVGVGLCKILGTRERQTLVPRPSSRRLLAYGGEESLFGFWDGYQGAIDEYRDIASTAGNWLAFNLNTDGDPMHYVSPAAFWTCFVLDQCQRLPSQEPWFQVAGVVQGKLLVRLLLADLFVATVTVVECAAGRMRRDMGWLEE